MNSLLNPDRPPAFCPGCSHERTVHALDKALAELSIPGGQVAIVSDIGCSGLFDVFFNTHAFHGLHGRALTYAAGIKLAKPDIHVIAIMGDGGMGIGGAHFLSACRRNLEITLLVLNNFNYGMTGGQCSATTPVEAVVSSGFLNRLEKPLDICRTAAVAGVAWAARISSYDKELVEKIQEAILFQGFSVLDIWGVCPGRYTRRNKLTPKSLEERLSKISPVDDLIAQNHRPGYGRAYREEAGRSAPAKQPLVIDRICKAPQTDAHGILLLGEAGQRIVTAGEIVCLAGASAGLYATQKNDYPITVMRGHSISETILSGKKIGYTGLQSPSTVLVLGQEGANRRRKIFGALSENAVIIKALNVDIDDTKARVLECDFEKYKIKPRDYALASLAVLAKQNRAINREMLEAALAIRFKDSVLTQARAVVETAGEQF